MNGVGGEGGKRSFQKKKRAREAKRMFGIVKVGGDTLWERRGGTGSVYLDEKNRWEVEKGTDRQKGPNPKGAFSQGTGAGSDVSAGCINPPARDKGGKGGKGLKMSFIK